MKLSQKLQGNIIMLGAMCIFGLNIPVTKYLYSTGLVTPLEMTGFRLIFAAIAFWITSLFLPYEKVGKKDLIILFVGGICGTILNQGLFAYGLGMTSPVDASIITTSGPLFALIIAALILHEPITFRKAGGVFVGGVGAIFLIYSSNNISSVESGSMFGNIAIASAQFFYAFYLVITRPLSIKYSPVTVNKWVFLFASIVFLPFSAEEMIVTPLFKQHEILPYLFLAFVLIGATYIAYLLIPMAQRRIRPTTISMYNNVQPVIATIVAINIGMDKFSIEKLLSAILIFAGVYMVTSSKSRADIEKEVKVIEK